MPGLKTLSDQLEGTRQARSTGFYTASFGIGSTISILVCGKIGATYGWPWAFGFGAVGPLLAALLVMGAMPPGRTRPRQEPTPPLLDFRPVVRNRTTLAYVV